MEEFRREISLMSTLHIDLIFLIFSHLPIKCLVRFKTVCKLWFSIISSSDFIKYHLRLNSLSSSNQLLIFSTNHQQSLYAVFFNSLQSPAMKLSFFGEDLSFSGIYGSCNGLLLCKLNSKTQNPDVCLLNPSTFQYKAIPKLKIPKNYLHINYGFGYDFTRDDYKIVRIVNFVYGYAYGSISNVREVMVYSLILDSWKFVEEKVSHHATLASRNGALVNNHLLHWMFWCTSMNEHRISSFDVCNEKWDEVSMPDCFENSCINRENQMNWLVCDGDDNKLDVVDLGVIGGCLCLLTNNSRRHSGDIDVWVMKNYGFKESWVRLFHVEDFDVTRSLKVAPIAYFKNGNEIFLRQDKDSNVFLYNLRERKVRSVEFFSVPDYHGVSTCIQSLVPLDGYSKSCQFN